MWKAFAVALVGVLVLATAAAAGESVIGKDPPRTQIRLAEETPERIYVLKGEIDPGADDELEDLIADRKGGWLVLDSEGGDVATSIWLGRLARLWDIKTYVPKGGTCLSACAMVWAGGSERWVSRTASLGFHRPWHFEDGKVVDGDVDRARRYFKEMGYNNVAIRWFLVPPSDFYYLTPERAKELGVEAHFQN